MKKKLKCLMPLLLLCMLFGTVQVHAADELLGTVVDGSLLTDGTEVSYTAGPKARATFIACGTGGLTLTAYRTLYMSGDTSCYQTVDDVNVTLHLQRLVNGTWTHVQTLGTKHAYNDYYVSTGKSYSVTGGYYYRVYGGHGAIEGERSEATTSYSDGLWVP